MVEVLFNGVAAAAITVRTSVGAANSRNPFQALPLATSAAASPTAPFVWPNPVRVAKPWQVRLAAATTRVEVCSLLGQLVLHTQFSGQTLRVPVPPLAPGYTSSRYCRADSPFSSNA